MGYSIELFLKSVDPNLICGICSGVLEMPVLILCGHAYCKQCLAAWLSRPGSNTCPECRTMVDSDSPKPILSLRNLIQEMEVKCTHSSRGCDVVFKLEAQHLHLLSCKFMPVTCVGCQTEVNLSDLADHQINCTAIKSELETDNSQKTWNRSVDNIRTISTSPFCTLNHNRRLISLPDIVPVLSSDSQVMTLLARISILEKQVSRLLEDLKESHKRNTLLNLQYKMAKDQLEGQQGKNSLRSVLQYKRDQDQLEDQQRLNGLRSVCCNVYECNSSENKASNQKDIVQLSLLIARHLLDKPGHLDSRRVFVAISNIYVSHLPKLQTDRNHDIHMLLATAYASNWFTSNQKTMLESWLQCVLQCRGCRRLVEG